ncbi:sodium:solute symporter [Bacillus cereus]|uniref:sodium:solute symporter family protein n=1 Tax=Bacillus nitratireducens TaxID=2026193 RepID=UPI0003180B7B|nr:sodium:solute symporter [Bacillus nitratireducens]PEB78932.1 sodium:solute symporter [Bacillus cereus]OJD44004.1 sodium:solute symporter [Bacillus nitratireducens]PEW84560.1 sodium:solute symporter [Bacillus cereus]PFH72377.1 sodium:solute symporter [Bacillus cereus]PFN79729.1 sodium:solute symporter [Bacillus cereus]
MNIAVFFILCFFVIPILISIRAKKGQEMDLEQWSVGGRGMGALLIFLLSAGEMYTTFTFLGASGSAYGEGGSIFSIITYGCLATVISYWTFPVIWRYAKKHNLVSQSDFFVKKYQSPYLGVLVAVIGVIACTCYLVLQLKGLGYIVSATSYGAISSTTAIWFGAIGVTIFVMVSGIHGSAQTSILKDILILGIVVFLGIYFPTHYYGGIQPMYEAIEKVKPNFTILPEQGMSISWYISTVILSSIGFYMWPHGFSPIFAASSEKALRKNAILMPMYQLILLFAFFVGFAAILRMPGLRGSDIDSILLQLSKQAFDPWFVGVIGGAGVLAALVPSSLLLMAISTLLAKNIYQVFNPSVTEKQLGKLVKYLVPFISLVGIYLTFKGGNTLFSLALIAYNFITQLAPAFFASLMRKNFVTKQGAFAGIITGGLLVSIMDLGNLGIGKIFPDFPQVIKDLNEGIIALFVNIVVLVIVSLMTKNISNVHRDKTTVIESKI